MQVRTLVCRCGTGSSFLAQNTLSFATRLNSLSSCHTTATPAHANATPMPSLPCHRRAYATPAPCQCHAIAIATPLLRPRLPASCHCPVTIMPLHGHRRAIALSPPCLCPVTAVPLPCHVMQAPCHDMPAPCHAVPVPRPGHVLTKHFLHARIALTPTRARCFPRTHCDPTQKTNKKLARVGAN